MLQMDQVWALISFILTLLVFSYLLGDHFLFRAALSIFIGVAAGYSAVIILYQVILPRLVYPLMRGGTEQLLLAGVPAVLGVLLLFKLTRRFARLGNASMGFLVGIGAALLIGGALTGTLTGQVNAAAAGFDAQTLLRPGSSWAGALTESILILFGTLSTLAYFHFSTRQKLASSGERSAFMKGAAFFGRFFIALTLGAVFAGVFSAALAALVDRLDFLTEFIYAVLF